MSHALLLHLLLLFLRLLLLLPIPPLPFCSCSSGSSSFCGSSSSTLFSSCFLSYTSFFLPSSSSFDLSYPIPPPSSFYNPSYLPSCFSLFMLLLVSPFIVSVLYFTASLSFLLRPASPPSPPPLSLQSPPLVRCGPRPPRRRWHCVNPSRRRPTPAPPAPRPPARWLRPAAACPAPAPPRQVAGAGSRCLAANWPSQYAGELAVHTPTPPLVAHCTVFESLSPPPSQVSSCSSDLRRRWRRRRR